jgi:hypothetical protein
MSSPRGCGITKSINLTLCAIEREVQDQSTAASGNFSTNNRIQDFFLVITGQLQQYLSLDCTVQKRIYLNSPITITRA